MTNPQELREEIDYLLNENRELGVIFDRLAAELDKHDGPEWLALYDALEPIFAANRQQARSNTRRINEILTVLGPDHTAPDPGNATERQLTIFDL